MCLRRPYYLHHRLSLFLLYEKVRRQRIRIRTHQDPKQERSRGPCLCALVKKYVIKSGILRQVLNSNGHQRHGKLMPWDAFAMMMTADAFASMLCL